MPRSDTTQLRHQTLPLRPAKAPHSCALILCVEIHSRVVDVILGLVVPGAGVLQPGVLFPEAPGLREDSVAAVEKLRMRNRILSEERFIRVLPRSRISLRIYKSNYNSH